MLKFDAIICIFDLILNVHNARGPSFNFHRPSVWRNFLGGFTHVLSGKLQSTELVRTIFGFHREQLRTISFYLHSFVVFPKRDIVILTTRNVLLYHGRGLPLKLRYGSTWDNAGLSKFANSHLSQKFQQALKVSIAVLCAVGVG